MVQLVVKSKLREAVDLNVSGEVAEVLNEKVQEILDDAAERAKENGRSTLQAKDL